MKTRYKLLLVVAIAATLACNVFYHPAIHLPAGIMAPEPPKQVLFNTAMVLTNSDKAFKDITVEAIGTYHLKAKVLGRADYYIGDLAKVVPIDLILGWQKLSDQAIVDKIHFSQGERWYRWSISLPEHAWPIKRYEIEYQSANTHIMPGDDSVRDKLAKIQPGQIVEMDGYLVNITHKKEGGRWYSSHSRTDTGKGACEIMYVSHLTTKKN